MSTGLFAVIGLRLPLFVHPVLVVIRWLVIVKAFIGPTSERRSHFDFTKNTTSSADRLLIAQPLSLANCHALWRAPSSGSPGGNRSA